MTPTQRTLRELKNQGRVAAIVEKWNPFVRRGDGGKGIRQDLFGFIDILALCPERGVVGIQCCGQSFSPHLKKMLSERTEMLLAWLETPGTGVELWGWRKIKVKRGGKAMRWAARVTEIRLSDSGELYTWP